MKINAEMTSNKKFILETALELFTQYGYDSVGVQMLCENSKITKPTLYYYFGNKEGVLRELLKENYDKLNSLILKNSTYKPKPHSYFEDVFPVLTGLANAYFQFAKNNETFYRLVMQVTFGAPTSTLNIVAKELNIRQYEIVENMFREISAVHANMRKREKMLGWTFIGMLNTYIALNKFGKDSIESAVRQFMHGIFS